MKKAFAPRSGCRTFGSPPSAPPPRVRAPAPCFAWAAPGLVLLLLPALLHAQVFRFRDVKGEKYHMVTEVTEEVRLDGEFLNSAEILDRIAVEVTDTRGTEAQLRGTFQVSTRNRDTRGLFHLGDEQATSEFWRDERGGTRIGAQHLYPIVRGIPSFPEDAIAPGTTWRAPAEEAHDLRDYGIAAPIKVPLDVVYTYIGREVRDGVETAVLRISYSATTALAGLRSPRGAAPARIIGTDEMRYYFDVAAGRVHSYEDHFYYVYLLNNGQHVEYEGTSKGHVVYTRPMDRAKVRDEIQKSIEEKRIPDTTVRADSEGVTISLENIQFGPDSDELLLPEKAKLEKIAEILKRYPDRDLLITGHTALAGTAEGRQELSDKRAAVVGAYLLQLGVRDRTQMRFRGAGASEPIADNGTEAGMRRNRRVEIKLLEN
jgi:outer membrane protein OmpA-like peptidoglycan-associated protein